MTVKSGAALAGRFVTSSTTGAATNADSLPTGTLVIAGDNNGATVTVSNVATGDYKWSVTCPSLTAGQSVQVVIAATVGAVAAKAVVFGDVADTSIASDLATTIGAAGAGLTAVGDTAGTTTLLSRLTSTRAGYLDNLSAGAVALQSTLTTVAGYIDTEVATIIANIAALPAAVWDRLTTALTTSGSIGAWILANAGSGASPATFWAYASRTLTQGAASVASTVSGSTVTTYRGTRWSVSLTGLPSYSTTTYTSIIVAIKRSTEDTDADSIVYIRKNRTGSPADGLIYFDGITSPTGAHASITADSATALTIAVEGAATQYATPGQYQYGIKILDASGYPVAESEGGSWIVVGDTPRAVS